MRADGSHEVWMLSSIRQAPRALPSVGGAGSSPARFRIGTACLKRMQFNHVPWVDWRPVYGSSRFWKCGHRWSAKLPLADSFRNGIRQQRETLQSGDATLVVGHRVLLYIFSHSWASIREIHHLFEQLAVIVVASFPLYAMQSSLTTSDSRKP